MENEYRGIFYDNINYSTKEVNLHFLIKVVGTNNGKVVERLVGLSGLLDEVGDYSLVNTLLTRAFKSKKDKIECRLRRGLKIIFFCR